MKQRAVAYTEEAANDLEWIYDTVARGSASPATAGRYETAIWHFCDRLGHAAMRGRRRDEVRPGLRIVGFRGRVTVAFVVEDERVVILRIFYGGADWERSL